MELEGRFQELERTLDRERDVWHKKFSQKEQELLSMRSQMNSQLEDYESLLGIKLALDMEINAYRKMLEVEEQRWVCDLCTPHTNCSTASSLILSAFYKLKYGMVPGSLVSDWVFSQIALVTEPLPECDRTSDT